MDIFFPGGLRRENDGWKLSTRVRFVHARIRALLSKREEWDHDAWGTPVSAAHLGSRHLHLLQAPAGILAILVGGRFSEEEKGQCAECLALQRLSHGDTRNHPLHHRCAEAKKIYEVAYLCEPAPDADSIAMANGLIRAIPGVAEVTDPAEVRSVTDLAYRLSRALIGNRLANRFEYPKTPIIGTLFLFRMKQRIQRALKGAGSVRSGNFSQLLQISAYDDYGAELRAARPRKALQVESVVTR